MMIQSDELIFFRGVGSTTNQVFLFVLSLLGTTDRNRNHCPTAKIPTVLGIELDTLILIVSESM